MKSKSTIGDIWDGIFGQWKKKAPVVEPAPLLLRICEKCGQVYQDGSSCEEHPRKQEATR
jgi:hypothetical protein